MAQANVSVRELFAQYLQETSTLLERPLGAIRKDSAERVQEQIERMSTALRAAADEWAREQNAGLNGLFASSASSVQVGRRLIAISGALLVLMLAAALLIIYTPIRQGLRESQAMFDRQEKLASLGTLATGVAHEIRNPLAAIKFRLFSLKKSLPTAFENHEDIAVIKHEIDRLEQMVKDFLQFARPADPKLVPVSARKMLQDVQALLHPQLEQKGIQLAAEAAD